jgi:hypothetical protein
MSKVLAKIKHEVFSVLPPVIFFVVFFNVLAISKALFDVDQGLEFTVHLKATVGALIVGKVVLLAELLPFIDRFPDRPLVYNVAWKAMIYFACAFVVKFIEELLHAWGVHGDLGSALTQVWGEITWPHFIFSLMWLLLLFVMYLSFAELIRVVGPKETLKWFFHSRPVAQNDETPRTSAAIR